MKWITIIILLSFIGCATANPTMRAASMQDINLGDSFDTVVVKAGQPDQVLSKELTNDDTEKVVWLYEVISVPPEETGVIRSHPDVRLKQIQAYEIEHKNNPPYLVVFTDGKVSKIERQK
jgi:hypothetical protein